MDGLLNVCNISVKKIWPNVNLQLAQSIKARVSSKMFYCDKQ